MVGGNWFCIGYFGILLYDVIVVGRFYLLDWCWVYVIFSCGYFSVYDSLVNGEFLICVGGVWKFD